MVTTLVFAMCLCDTDQSSLLTTRAPYAYQLLFLRLSLPPFVPTPALQESSSEAVNSYYAVSLLGRVLGDPDLTRWGQLLTSIEVSGAQHYWQIPSSSTVYPAPFRNTKVVGVLWSSKVDYSTWFGNNPALMHGIQYIPFNPMSEVLLRKEWVIESYPVATSQPDLGLPPCWVQFAELARAVYDPQAAWRRITAITNPGAFYGGWASHPKSVQLYWIASRKQETSQ